MSQDIELPAGSGENSMAAPWLRQLGVLGLSTSAQMELETLRGRLIDDDLSQFRFDLGLRFMVESLELAASLSRQQAIEESPVHPDSVKPETSPLTLVETAQEPTEPVSEQIAVSEPASRPDQLLQAAVPELPEATPRVTSTPGAKAKTGLAHNAKSHPRQQFSPNVTFGPVVPKPELDRPTASVKAADFDLSSLPDRTAPEALRSDIIKCCSPHWSQAEITSLQELLKAHVLTDDSIPARTRLRRMLVAVAPRKDKNDALTPAEWDAINLLTGLDFSQSMVDKMLPFRFMESKLKAKYGPDSPSGLVVLRGAIFKLTTHYTGTYGETVPPRLVLPPSQADRPKRLAESDKQPDKLTQLLEDICESQPTPTNYLQILKHHFDGKKGVVTVTNLKDVDASIFVVRNAWSIAQDRQVSRGDTRPDHVRKAGSVTFSSRDNRLLTELLGNSRHPSGIKSFDQIVQDRRLMQKLGILNPEQLKRQIIIVLEKVHQLSAL